MDTTDTTEAEAVPTESTENSGAESTSASTAGTRPISADRNKVRPDNEDQAAPMRERRRLSVGLSTVAWLAAVVVGFVAAATFLVLWLNARSQVTAGEERAAADRHAEQVAGDYALGAATVNYQNIAEWTTRLKSGTTPELAGKFDATAPKLAEVLTPLKWTSTATPITAKVMSEANGIYKVSVFLNVTSTNAQNPDGTQATVTYSVTLDSNADWKITDVGGMDGALPVK